MAENDLLINLDVHCVFPTSEHLQKFIINSQEKYQIRSISFTSAFL